MIDLTKDKSINLPDSIFVDGKEYKIHTSFRYGMMFCKLIENKALLTDFDCFYMDYYNIPSDRQKGIDELAKFYCTVEPLPNRDEMDEDNGTDSKVFDYILDSPRIYAAFMQCYHIDLIDSDMHWVKFLALFHGLKGTQLNDIMGYRCYDPNDKSELKDIEARNKRLWEIPVEPTEEEQARLDKFNAQFD